MGKSEFTENVAIWLRRQRLVRARVEAHPPVSAKQERTSHCLIGNNAHLYRKRRGWRTVMIELDGHLGLSIGAE